MATKKHDKPIPKTTTGKGKNYNPTEKGAGMTAKGRACLLYTSDAADD